MCFVVDIIGNLFYDNAFYLEALVVNYNRPSFKVKHFVS